MRCDYELTASIYVAAHECARVPVTSAMVISLVSIIDVT